MVLLIQIVLDNVILIFKGFDTVFSIKMLLTQLKTMVNGVVKNLDFILFNITCVHYIVLSLSLSRGIWGKWFGTDQGLLVSIR